MNKTCPRCKRELPIDAFCKNRSRKDGLAAYCRECNSVYFKELNKSEKHKLVVAKWREENADRIREQNRIRMRAYSKTENGRKYQREYQKSEKYKAWLKNYRKEDAQHEKHRLNNAKPEAVAQRKAHQSTPEFKEKRRAYRQSEKGKQAIATAAHNRRAIERGLPKSLTTKQWRLMLSMYDGRCAYCGSTDGIQQDHVVPVCRGGGTTFSNVVPACKTCNMSKKDKPLLKWMLKGIPSRKQVLVARGAFGRDQNKGG